jgi:ATP/maltotriose-dependent transcriptional regulator MalT
MANSRTTELTMLWLLLAAVLSGCATVSDKAKPSAAPAANLHVETASLTKPASAGGGDGASGQALAVAGVTQLRQGQLAAGLWLLQRAVEGSPGADWPHRSQAVADLGLAYLMNGRKDEGLAALHQAQALFRAEGHFKDLSQSLLNEALFLEQSGDKPHADVLRREAGTGQADRVQS